MNPTPIPLLQKLAIPLFLALAIFVVYIPGLTGGFVLDDTSNIVETRDVHMTELSWTGLKQAALSMPYRPISRATFGLNHIVDGLDPYGYKLVNIVIHLVNSLLLFSVVLLLFREVGKDAGRRDSGLVLAALFVTLAWAVHPINVTSVLYVVQRMTELSALFTLCGIIGYLIGRRQFAHNWRLGLTVMVTSLLACSLLAYYSKENGALLPLFLFIIEFTVFRFRVENTAQKNALVAYFTVFLFIPALYAIYYVYTHPWQFFGSYQYKPFTVGERLLTEARVIWIYLKMILLPTPGSYGLFLDFIPLSRGLLSPVSTLLSIAGLLALLISAILVRKWLPLLSLGILFFLSGHLIESTIVPLEIAFEHRNYLPSIGILLPLFYYLLFPWKHERIQLSQSMAAIVIVVLLGFITHLRAIDWSSEQRLYLTEAHYHPGSTRANYEAGKVYGQRIERGLGNREENYQEAVGYFLRAAHTDPSDASGLFGLVLATLDMGRQPEPTWLEELRRRLELEPFAQVNIYWLQSLIRCTKAGKCKAEVIDLEEMLDAAERNKYLNKRTRSMLYMLQTDYYLSAVRDLNEAVHYSSLNIKLQPSNLDVWMNHLNVMMSARRWPDAQAALIRVRELDQHNLKSEELKLLERQLDMFTIRLPQ